MTRMPQSYFDQLYAASPDPWGFSHRWYEHRKYRLTVDSLPRPRYRSGFEPGCSIGVLTRMLASRCERLIAGDPVPCAVEEARRRLQGEGHVDLRILSIPEGWPEQAYDLIVLSEIGYYFDGAELKKVLRRIRRDLEPGGTLAAVHWTGPTNYPLGGAQVHHLIADTPGLAQLVHHQEADFLLGVWERAAT